MRIAHIGSKGIPSKGGTERVVEALAVRQAKHNHVTVYGSSRVCASGRHLGVRIIALPQPKWKHVGPVLLQLHAAAHALAWGRYDIVHVHASENGFIVPLLRLRFPVLSTNHGPAYEREKWGALARRLIRGSDRFSVRPATIATAVAANQAETLSRRYRREVVHVPNGVAPEPVDRIAAGRILEAARVQSGTYLLFSAARVDPTKGCHTLLEALHGLEEPPPLIVVGDLHHASGYEEQLRTAAQGLRVTFVPRLDDKATLLGLLRQCRVFVFPSTVEAMSMMLLEALSTGAVTLSSDIPENTAVLPPDFLTFRAGDPVDLGQQLVVLLAKDDSYRRRFQDCAGAWVREHYDWASITAQHDHPLPSGAGEQGIRRWAGVQKAAVEDASEEILTLLAAVEPVAVLVEV